MFEDHIHKPSISQTWPSSQWSQTTLGADHLSPPHGYIATHTGFVGFNPSSICTSIIVTTGFFPGLVLESGVLGVEIIDFQCQSKQKVNETISQGGLCLEHIWPRTASDPFDLFNASLSVLGLLYKLCLVYFKKYL